MNSELTFETPLANQMTQSSYVVLGTYAFQSVLIHTVELEYAQYWKYHLFGLNYREVQYSQSSYFQIPACISELNHHVGKDRAKLDQLCFSYQKPVLVVRSIVNMYV